MWSTGDWQAVGDCGSRQKPLWFKSVPRHVSVHCPLFIAVHLLYFCLNLWLTLNNFYVHDMCLFYDFLRPGKTYFNVRGGTLKYVFPGHTHTYTSSFSPSSPHGLRAYGLAGQEIREMCQPVVLNKHIFPFFLSSLTPLPCHTYFSAPLLSAPLLSFYFPLLLSQSAHLVRLCDGWVQLGAKRDVVIFAGDGEGKRGREWASDAL